MQRPKVADLEALLLALHSAGVEFIIVGGAAAVILGAPTTTWDLDIVPAQDPQNLDNLMTALDEIKALVRPVWVGREIVPTRELFAGTGQVNLASRLGPLDILCRLHDARGYAELLPLSSMVTDGALAVRVINLEPLIEIKRAAGRPKDLLVVQLLEAMRDRRLR